MSNGAYELLREIKDHWRSVTSSRKFTDASPYSCSYTVIIQPPEDVADSFFYYAECYQMAARETAQHLLNAEIPDIAKLDTWFFPLAFMYRHSTELILKALILKENPFVGNEIATHDLKGLMDKLLKNGQCPLSEENLKWIDDFFVSESEVDNGSDSFRYPVGLSKDLVLDEQLHVNLIALANKFENLFDVFRDWYLKRRNSFTLSDMSPVFLETGGSYYEQSVVGYNRQRRDRKYIWADEQHYAWDDLGTYIDGYHETAEYLWEIIITDYDCGGEKDFPHWLIMPMCYMYRVSIELAAKRIIIDDIWRYAPVECWKRFKRAKHRVDNMWDYCRKMIPQVYSQYDCGTDMLAAEYDNIYQRCQNLQDYDKDASRFRYPCNKKMQFYYRQKETLDLINIAEFMEQIFIYLDGVDTELKDRNDYISQEEYEQRVKKNQNLWEVCFL